MLFFHPLEVPNFLPQYLKVTGVVFRLDTQHLSMLSQILPWFKPQATPNEKTKQVPLKLLQDIPCCMDSGPCPKAQSILYHNCENVCLACPQNTLQHFLVVSHQPIAFRVCLLPPIEHHNLIPHFLFYCSATCIWSEKRWGETFSTKRFHLE